jgi:hypothetical protein
MYWNVYFLYSAELIALKQNKKTTIDPSDQSESDSGFYYEDSMERVKELHSEFPQEEVDIFSAPRIEVILISTIPLMCFYVTCWN